jgi:PleD family two-component response regulator
MEYKSIGEITIKTATNHKVNSRIDNLNKRKLRANRAISENVLSSKASDSHYKIMIVDDNQEIVRLFAITLQDNGFVVDVFNDPLSALANYKLAFMIYYF